MLSEFAVLAWGVVGGMLRIIIGYTFSYPLVWNHRRATLTVLSALFVSAIAAVLIDSDNPRVLVLAGFGGIDALNAVYRGAIRRETGIAPALPDFNPGLGQGYPNWASQRQRKALDYLVKNGRMTKFPIDEQAISDHLYTQGMPDPDLLIRTGGEMRVSNFLLWQIAYSEIWMTPLYWPDFNQEHLIEAIDSYARRQRRFGKRSL